MILPLALAAATAAYALDGIKLGDDAAKIALAEKAHVGIAALGPTYRYPRNGGGIMLVAADGKGKVIAVDFIAQPGESDAIDLPGASAFPVNGTQAQFEEAAGLPHGDDCPPQNIAGTCASYLLDDGTELLLQFGGSVDRGIKRATWAQRATLLQLHVIPPGYSSP